jgi:hypothetical protein
MAAGWGVGRVGLVSETTWTSWSSGLAAHGVISIAFRRQVTLEQGGIVTGGRIHRRMGGGDRLGVSGSFTGRRSGRVSATAVPTVYTTMARS